MVWGAMQRITGSEFKFGSISASNNQRFFSVKLRIVMKVINYNEDK